MAKKSCGCDSGSCAWQFQMKDHQLCKVLCRKTLTEEEVKNFHEKIDNDYRVNM
jgi:transmembrane 9 superfamily protein 2/4